MFQKHIIEETNEEEVFAFAEALVAVLGKCILTSRQKKLIQQGRNDGGLKSPEVNTT